MQGALRGSWLIWALALAGCGESPTAVAPAGKAQVREWRAEPAMISNVGVYREHEFVFQDYVYDDHGANTDARDRFDAPLGAPGPDPSDPTNLRMSPAPLLNWAGDFTYASPDGAHMATVADLIEFRVAADHASVYYRFLLGDMTAPDSTVIGMCVDEDLVLGNGLAAWPFGANLNQQLGCDRFYTIYGTGARVTDAAGQVQELAALGGTVTADVAEAIIELRVPRAVADPGHGRWRLYVGAGVWDAGAGAWSAPSAVPAQAGAPIATGGSPLAPAIFDLLSNNREPNSTWNEEKQANDLAAHNILDDYLDVDFARLASGRSDPDPERTGTMVRLYRSQHPMAQGRGIEIDGANYIYAGPWQPYTVVIPHDYYAQSQKRFPFDQCLHPLGTNHNVEVFYAEAFARRDYNPLVTGVFPSSGYLGFTQIEALVDRQQIVYACVLGRGEGVGYQGGDGMVDALEVRADMLQRYRVDMDRNTLHGVSLGAIGSWYVSRLYPDRYAAVMPYIFTHDLVATLREQPTLKNLHNLPVFFSIGTLDQFGQGADGDPIADRMRDFGNEFLYLHYLGRQHEGRIEQDFLPFVDRLAYTRALVKDPPRVRYLFQPSMFSGKLPGSGAAYWVSGMTLRDATAEDAAADVDVVSLARADQLPRKQVVFDGVWTNTDEGHFARIRGLFRMSLDEFRALWHPEVWQPGWVEHVPIEVTETELPVEGAANAFRLTAVNLAVVTLDAGRMGLSRSTVHYSVLTDGPIQINLSDGRTLRLVEAGTFEGDL